MSREATLPDLYQLFLDRCEDDGLKPKTIRYYGQCRDKFLRFCAEKALSDPREVSPDHLADYKKWLQDPSNHPHGNNGQSVATWERGVRALFSWAELKNYVDYSPFNDYRIKQPKLQPQEGFSADEVRRMLDAIERQSQNRLRDRAIVLLLFDTGMRRVEVGRLDVDDVVDDRGRIRENVVVRGKGDKFRKLELDTQTQRAIYEYLVEERPDHVASTTLFLARGSRTAPGWHALTLEGYYQLVARLARRIGLKSRPDGGQKRLGPHSMRVAYAHEYLEDPDARIDDLQILLGHSSFSMTALYAGLEAATARRNARTHSPVAKLGIHLGKRLRRGRPKKTS